MSATPSPSNRPGAAALLALVLGGCAFSTRNATLIYPPAPSGHAVGSAHADTPAAATHGTIALLPFADRRADPSSVGTVRSGLGMKTAPVRAVNGVEG